MGPNVSACLAASSKMPFSCQTAMSQGHTQLQRKGSVAQQLSLALIAVQNPLTQVFPCCWGWPGAGLPWVCAAKLRGAGSRSHPCWAPKLLVSTWPIFIHSFSSYWAPSVCQAMGWGQGRTHRVPAHTRPAPILHVFAGTDR